MNIEIHRIEKSNLLDFYFLLSERGGTKKNVNECVYANRIYYDGFIAYVNARPAGCIGLVKRKLNTPGVDRKITWFNDWFVLDEFRGQDIGKKLLESVGKYYGVSCGIITPQSSQFIAPKIGFFNETNYYECIFSFAPYLFGFKKYCDTGVYKDGIAKRSLRGLKSFVDHYKYRFSYWYKMPKNNFKEIITTDVECFLSQSLEGIIETKSEALISFDNKHLQFIYNTISKYTDNWIEYWSIDIGYNIQIFGYNRVLKNGIREAIILYVNNVNHQNITYIISSLFSHFYSRNIVEQLNIILPDCVLKKIKIAKGFQRKLPFFTFNLDYGSNMFIHHMDKDSSWR